MAHLPRPIDAFSPNDSSFTLGFHLDASGIFAIFDGEEDKSADCYGDRIPSGRCRPCLGELI